MPVARLLSGPLRAPSRVRLFLGLATVVLALLALLSGAVIAAVRPAVDFSPFTMTITEWTTQVGSDARSGVTSGTIVTRLEYRSVRNWTATIISHSLDPAYEGSTNRVNDDSRSFFDALTRQTFGRIARGEAAEVPDRWLIPGLMQVLPSRGFVSSPGNSGDTIVFTQNQLVNAQPSRQGQPGKTIRAVTRAVFDVTSRLPVSVEEFADGLLVSTAKYVVTSRP